VREQCLGPENGRDIAVHERGIDTSASADKVPVAKAVREAGRDDARRSGRTAGRPDGRSLGPVTARP